MSVSAIVRPGLVVSDGQTEVGQGPVEQIARVIAGERAARAVGAPQAGRQPHNQEAGTGRPESLNRCIVPLRLVGAPPLPIGDESRAKRAIPVGFAGHVSRKRQASRHLSRP